MQTGCQRRRHRLRMDTDLTASYAPVLPDLLIHRPNNVTRRRETQTFVSAALGHDQRIDSDKPSVQVHERAAAAAGVNRCICLYIDHRGFRLELPCYGTNYSERNGVSQAKRTTDSEHQLTRPQLIRVTERHHRQI